MPVLESDLLSRGFELLTLGVGVLFAFAACLFVLVKAITAFCTHYDRLYPALVPVQIVSVRTQRDRARLAAVVAAVHRYRTRLL